jgi:hypothetical protein
VAVKLLLDDCILIARHESNCLVTDPFENDGGTIPTIRVNVRADADSVGD